MFPLSQTLGGFIGTLTPHSPVVLLLGMGTCVVEIDYTDVDEVRCTFHESGIKVMAEYHYFQVYNNISNCVSSSC